MECMMEDSSIVKRKRTKRQRHPHSSAAMGVNFSLAASTSAQFSEITTKEEEMANCLLLLAQNGHKTEFLEPNMTEEATTTMKFMSRQFAEAATSSSSKDEIFDYKCKTSNKCFLSFDALGGHRTSHKKSKLSIPLVSGNEPKAAVMNEDSIELGMNCFSVHVKAKARIHKCSKCGIEFNSGQALGGHMGRHRLANPHKTGKIEGNSNRLLLDLNLPPPCDDGGHIKKSSSSVSPTKKDAAMLLSSLTLLNRF